MLRYKLDTHFAYLLDRDFSLFERNIIQNNHLFYGLALVNHTANFVNFHLRCHYETGIRMVDSESQVVV